MKKLATTIIASCCLLAMASMAFANSTPQTLPFSQNWTNVNLITVSDDWSGVPGIVGFRGDDMTAATGVDPQTLLGDGTITVDVNAQALVSISSGGVSELDGLPNPVVAFQGSGTGDAPHIVFYLDTSCYGSIQVSYNLRDVDDLADNAIQQVALQYRIGNAGNWTNLPAGYVADASTGPSLAVLVTPVSVTLPAACDNQPGLQVRVMTTNAVGNDELIGVDDIVVTGTNTCPPTGACCLRNSPPPACQIMTASACQSIGGIYLGDGTQCVGTSCATPGVSKTWGSVKTLYR